MLHSVRTYNRFFTEHSSKIFINLRCNLIPLLSPQQQGLQPLIHQLVHIQQTDTLNCSKLSDPFVRVFGGKYIWPVINWSIVYHKSSHIITLWVTTCLSALDQIEFQSDPNTPTFLPGRLCLKTVIAGLMLPPLLLNARCSFIRVEKNLGILFFWGEGVLMLVPWFCSYFWGKLQANLHAVM